jgi:hypothetical protein
VDRVYLSSSGAIAVFDHEKKRTFTIRKEGLPDVGETSLIESTSINKNMLIFKIMV